MKKQICIATLIAALVFTACEGPAGADGTPGTQGPAGGAGVMVYDSATRLLGYVLSGDDYSVTILTPTNKVHTVTMTTGEPHATPISFLTTSTPTNQTTTPYVLSNAVAPANPSYYYNPNGGGLYFKYAGASVTSHTDQVGEYYYHYDGSLSTSYAGGPYNYYALEWTTESAYNTGVYGFAPTLPLKYSITVLP